MDGWMDEWMDGWMDGLMGGWIQFHCSDLTENYGPTMKDRSDNLSYH